MEARIIFKDEKLKEKDERLYKEIQNAFNIIRQNVFVGRNVKKGANPKRIYTKV